MIKLINYIFSIKNIILDNEFEFKSKDDALSYIKKIIDQRNIFFIETFSVIGISLGLIRIFFDAPYFIIGLFSLIVILISMFIIMPENKILLSDDFIKNIVNTDLAQ